jgi:hypothetical protein
MLFVRTFRSSKKTLVQEVANLNWLVGTVPVIPRILELFGPNNSLKEKCLFDRLMDAFSN